MTTVLTKYRTGNRGGELGWGDAKPLKSLNNTPQIFCV